MIAMPLRLALTLALTVLPAPALLALPHGGNPPPEPALPPVGGPVGRPGQNGVVPTTAAPSGVAGVGTSARSGAARGGSGRTGATTYSSQRSSAQTLSSWEPWWDQNKDRFLNLREQLARGHSASGSPGLLTGRGRKASWRNSQRVDPDLIEGQVIPVLLEVLVSSDHREMLDSAVLALARIAPDHRAPDIFAATLPLLAHSELSVQTSAALSLGVLGSPASSALLLAVARDDSSGREAVGGGPVPRQVRAHAAFALGLVADARSVYSMLQLITRLPDAERDIKASALAGLGMLPSHHSQLDVIETVLTEMLTDPRLDPMVASYVPTTLAKLGRTTALPALLRSFNDKDASHPLRQSVALALGRLGTLQDQVIAQALFDEVSEGKDRMTRQFSLISLAQMGGRGEWTDEHLLLIQVIGRELRGTGQSQEHRSWAAMAAAVLGRAQADAQPLLLERLRASYLSESDPSFKGAFAMALGLLGDSQSAEAIHRDFREVADQGFQGHAAVALGFLQYIDCSETLRALCLDSSSSEALRVSSATSLGLLGDTTAVPVLVDALRDTGSLSTRAALAKAVGLIGDRSAVEPLLQLINDADQSPQSRAFACVALGLLAERRSLPFNEPLKADGNYRVPVDSIQELLTIL